MPITLKRASIQDAEALHRMQVEAFAPLLAKYNDFAISPACETVERVRQKLAQPQTRYYFILQGRRATGAIRVVLPSRPDGCKVISPLYILAPWRNRGFAQQAVLAAEAKYGADGWALDTIPEEPGNCHLYEKLGYRRIGARRVNARMTIVDYEKN